MEVQESLRTKEQNRKLWWLFGKIGFDREAVACLVEDWTEGRTSHTSELTFIEARELIARLEESRRSPRVRNHAGKELADLERLRKGVIKAIFAWFEAQGKTVTMEYVKSVACRAAGGKLFFNKLTEGDLRRIYAEFCKKQTAATVKRKM